MSLFAVATVFNMNMLNENGGGDVSLKAISVMAQAQGEEGENHCVWIVVQTAPDYSWFKKSCRQTLYPDTSKPSCTCGTGDVTVYL